MTTIGTTGTDLHWDVLTIKRPGLTRELPPGKEQLMWVANSSTLIYGERDAILVDTFLTTEQSKTLLGWVVARGKNLTGKKPTPKVLDPGRREMLTHGLDDLGGRDRLGSRKALQERCESEEMIAVSVGDIDRGEVLAARDDPTQQGL